MATVDRWEEIDTAYWMYVTNALPVPLDWPPFPTGDERIQIAKDMLADRELWGIWEQVVWESPNWIANNPAYRPGNLPEDEESRRMNEEVEYIEPLKRVSSVEIIWYEVEGVRVMFWTVFVTWSIVVILCPAPPIVQVIPFIPFILPNDSGDVIGLPLVKSSAGFSAGKRRR